MKDTPSPKREASPSRSRAGKTATRGGRRNSLVGWVQLAFAAIATVLVVVAANMAWGDIPRTEDGKPDFSGFYDTATTTPLQRQGENATLTEEEAAEVAERTEELLAIGSQEQLDPNREAPPEGGDGSPGPAGNVGGYQSFWIDVGEQHTKIDGEYRASIIIDPPNGRMPRRKLESFRRDPYIREYSRQNDGTAWWGDEPGPYDDPEIRPLPDRCLIGFSSTGGPPMLPALYNNHKRIVQTPQHIMILTEMVHDARIVRMDGEHLPDDVRRWYGDSIGWWEGDTLVVETTNFNDTPALGYGTSRDLKVLERFTLVDGESLLYRFTVEDPRTWDTPWSGEYVWPRTDEPVYEYACHEGNYSMGNILCGARRLEAEAAGGEALEAFMNTPCGRRAGFSGSSDGSSSGAE